MSSKVYSNQPRKPMFTAEEIGKAVRSAPTFLTQRPSSPVPKRKKVTGYVAAKKEQRLMKESSVPRANVPDLRVNKETNEKLRKIQGNISFDLEPLRLTGFGSRTKVRGNVKENATYKGMPAGTHEQSWKSIENNIGGALGYQVNKNNRVGIQINKRFFENQKGSENQVNLNYSVMDLGGGNLDVSLTGTDPFSGKKTKAMNLRYKVDF